jgi:hypothetical protein
MERSVATRSLSRVAISAAVLGILAVSVDGCLFDNDGSCGPCSPSAPIWPRPDFSEAAQTVTVDQRTYAIQSFVWRDFMPGDPCTKLTCVVRFIAIDSLPLPEGTTLGPLWIRHGDDWWNVEFTNENPPEPYLLFRTSAVARCGPSWPTGDLVDVSVRIRFGSETELYMRESGVEIVRTE